MAHTTLTLEPTDHMLSTEPGCGADLAPAPSAGLSRRHRGMVTIEYAIGVVMVIALIGVIVIAITQGQDSFNELVKNFITFLTGAIKDIFQK